jgi:hypothetical protein
VTALELADRSFDAAALAVALGELQARLRFDAERRRDMRRAIDTVVALLTVTEGATLQQRWERVEAEHWDGRPVMADWRPRSGGRGVRPHWCSVVLCARAESCCRGRGCRSGWPGCPPTIRSTAS